MITSCEKCGKKYQLDHAKIKGTAFRFTCRSCGHQNIVKKPHKKSLALAPAPAVSKPIGIASPPENRMEKSTSSEKSKEDEYNPYSFKRQHRFRFGLMARLFIIMVLIGLTPLITCWAFTLGQGQARIDLLMVTIVFICVAAWLSGHALSKPLIKLAEVVYRISIGEIDKEIIIKRGDEIGNLSESIVRMQDSLRISIEKLQRKS